MRDVGNTHHAPQEQYLSTNLPESDGLGGRLDGGAAHLFSLLGLLSTAETKA